MSSGAPTPIESAASVRRRLAICRGRAVRLALLIVACPFALAQCASAPQVERPAIASLPCMRAVVRDKVPLHVSDKQAHCLAAGLIARYCSRPEAYLAGAGKEITDLFDGGDAEWNDWVADRLGIGCERHAASDGALVGCCREALAARRLPQTPEHRPAWLAPQGSR